MFFFHKKEYQHVHLLWFKKRSFILVWKPNPPLLSVCGAHLQARADAASINQALPTKRSHWKRLSSRDQWNLTPATMCCGWQRALYEADALEQCRPCTRTSATTSNFYSHTLKKWAQMWPFWSQARVLCRALKCDHFSRIWDWILLGAI